MKGIDYIKNNFIGYLVITEEEDGISSVRQCSKKPEIEIIKSPEIEIIKSPEVEKCKKQLEEYFSGKRKNFDLKLDIRGTEFRKKAWNELLKIPYGETITYGEQARRLGNPKSSRAVGQANGDNKILIVVPCHRVIGKNGKMTGFSSEGGIKIKEYLLELEKNNK